MLNVRLTGDHLYGNLLFTWLWLVMSMMVYCAVLFPTRCLGWDLELNWVSFWGFSYLLFPTIFWMLRHLLSFQNHYSFSSRKGYFATIKLPIIWHAKILLILSFLRFISNFRGFGSKIKNINFRDFLISQPVIAQKLKPFIKRCVKGFTGRLLGNNTVPVFYFYFTFFYIKL